MSHYIWLIYGTIAGREITGLNGKVPPLENVPQTLAVLYLYISSFMFQPDPGLFCVPWGAKEKGKKREQPASPLRTFFAVVLESSP